MNTHTHTHTHTHEYRHTHTYTYTHTHTYEHTHKHTHTHTSMLITSNHHTQVRNTCSLCYLCKVKLWEEYQNQLAQQLAEQQRELQNAFTMEKQDLLQQYESRQNLADLQHQQQLQALQDRLVCQCGCIGGWVLFVVYFCSSLRSKIIRSHTNLKNLAHLQHEHLLQAFWDIRVCVCVYVCVCVCVCVCG